MEDEVPVGADGQGSRPLRTPREAELLVVDAIQQNAERLLRAAHRWTGCPEDAQDAYQRTLEIFVKRSTRLHEDDLGRWLATTCKYESLAVRRQRTDQGRLLELDADLQPARELPTPEERAVDGEVVTRAAEALGTLKPQELQALWHQALGKSYAEIGDELGWTYTKVNRCIAEGRRALAATVERIDSGAECERVEGMLSALLDGEVSRDERRTVRRHLRACPGCRAQARELDRSRGALAALLPTVAVAAPAPGDGAGLVSRISESVLHLVGERATMSALKLQSAAEMIGGGKVAAMAASAAAVAGGGAVVAGEVTRSRPEPVRAVRATTTSAPVPGPRATVRRVGPATTGRAAAPAPSRSPRKSHSGEFASGRSKTGREFSTRRSGSRRTNEFSSGARTASAGAAPVPTSAAPTPRATVSPERPAAPQGGPEFGL